MNWWLVASLGLLGSVGQLRAQPTTGLFSKAQPIQPPSSTRPARTPTPNQAADLRAAWLAATAEPAKPDSGAVATSPAVGQIALLVELLSASSRPAHDFLQVQLTGYSDEITVRLLNSRGRVVRRQRSRPPLRLAVRSLEPGRYFLLATDVAGQLLADCQNIVIGP